MNRLMTWLKAFVTSYIVPHAPSITRSVIASAIFALLSFGVGYGAGFVSGREAGITAHLEEKEAAVNKIRDDADADMKQRKADFEKDLATTKANFMETLDEIVASRYQTNVRELETLCNEKIHEFRSSGSLWMEYERRVSEWRRTNPQTEIEMRAIAGAIVSTAHHGRKAALVLAEQLNGVVDDIDTALNDGNLERVKQLILELEMTLPAKRLLWQDAFRFLAVFGNA